MPLIKRLVKGSPLTFAEGDANLDYLENLSNSALTTAVTTFSNWTGSSSSQFAGTASFAANALTASYLTGYVSPFPFTGSAAITGSLNVIGPITATTLVVQTITSSTEYITGSTRFGSLLSNTHQFTGSIITTGSLIVGSSTSTYGLLMHVGGGMSVAGTTRFDGGVGTPSQVNTPKITGYGTQLYIVGINSLDRNIFFDNEEVNAGAGNYVTFYTGRTFNTVGTGSANLLHFPNSISAISSSGTLTYININPTINQATGSGTIYGFRFNPVNTSVSSSVYSIYADSGNAYFRGNIGINKITASAALDVSGSVNITGSLTTAGTSSFNGPVGIGTTLPSYNLDISGSMRVSYTASGVTTSQIDITPTITSTANFQSFNLMTINPTWNSGGFGNSTIYALKVYKNMLVYDELNNLQLTIDSNTVKAATAFRVGGFQLYNDNRFYYSSGIYFNNSNTDRNYMANNGNFILGGTTDAGYKLDVQGTSRFTNNIIVSGSVTATSFTGSLSGSATSALTASYVNPLVQNVIITGSLTISGSDATINGLTIGKGGGNQTFSTAVGVDAMTATVTGNYNTAVGYRALRLVTSGISNTSLGYNAGSGITTGGYNTFIGASVGSGTTSDENTLVGANIGVTSGTRNTVMGAFAANVLTSGGSNTYIGWYAGVSATTSAANTGIGSQALAQITTGGNNTALGYWAGRFWGAGLNNNTSSANSVYLGYDTRASANGNTNEIVIGYGATGNGSNTATLGNTSITSTILQGNTLIGTTTNAGYKLDINGTARIQGTGLVTNLMTANTFGLKIYPDWNTGYYASGPYDALLIDGTLAGGFGLYTGQNYTFLKISGSNNSGLPLLQVDGGGRFRIANNLYSIGQAPTSSLNSGYTLSEIYINPLSPYGDAEIDAFAIYGTNLTYYGSSAAGKLRLMRIQGASREAITVSATGRVGLGVLNPLYDVHISGSTNLTGSLTVTSGITGSLQGTSSYALSTVQPTSGKVIYVDGSSPNATNTRGSLSKYNATYPFTTIQAAVNTAANGDSIWVYPGTYNESIVIGPSGSVTLNMLLYSGVTINGGSSFAIYSGTGSQCGLNLDMMPNSVIRNTGTSSDPSGSAVLQKSSNSGINLTGIGNPLAKSMGASVNPYTTSNPSIISTNAYCLYNFGANDFNGEKASGVTFYSENSIPIYNDYGSMTYENCVIYAPNNYGISGQSIDSFINCLIISGKTCYYNSNYNFCHFVNCDLYSTNEFGIRGTNNLPSNRRIVITDCRINSFSQSIQLSSNNTQGMNYEICNNVMGSRNLASSTIVSISDTNANSVGIFSNNVVNKSTVTIPSTIGEFNTYISNDVSGSIPYIIT